MAPEAVTADRVHVGLRHDIVGGRYAPGAILIVQTLAGEYGTSIAPVRDALHRLMGEGLVAPQPGGGFQLPMLTEKGLRDLYVWHGQVLRLAVKHRSGPSISIDMSSMLEGLDPQDDRGIADATTILFDGLAAGSRNAEHAAAIAGAGARLYATRLRESLIKNRVDELHAVWTATASGREPAIRDAIWAYHRRRLRRVPALLRKSMLPD